MMTYSQCVGAQLGLLSCCSSAQYVCACVCLCVLMCSVLQELGLGNIERCRGFSSHLFKLLLRQRRRLATLTQQWVGLRSV